MSSTNSRGGTGVKNNLPLTLKPPYVMKLSFPVCISQALPTLAPVIFGDEELFVHKTAVHRRMFRSICGQ